MDVMMLYSDQHFYVMSKSVTHHMYRREPGSGTLNDLMRSPQDKSGNEIHKWVDFMPHEDQGFLHLATKHIWLERPNTVQCCELNANI